MFVLNYFLSWKSFDSQKRLIISGWSSSWVMFAGFLLKKCWYWGGIHAFFLRRSDVDWANEKKISVCVKILAMFIRWIKAPS